MSSADGGSLVSNTWQVDGLIYRVEISSSLNPGVWVYDVNAVVWPASGTDEGGGIESVNVRMNTALDAAGAQYFIKLIVEPAP